MSGSTNYLMINQKSKLEIPELVFWELQELYDAVDEENEEPIPHWLNWSEENHNTHMPLFQPVRNPWEKRKNKEAIENGRWESNYEKHVVQNKSELPKKIAKLKKQYAQEYYLRRFLELQKGKDCRAYCEMITELIIGVIDGYIAYDAQIGVICDYRRKSFPQRKLYFEDEYIRDANTKKEVEIFDDHNYKIVKTSKLKPSATDFAEYAKTQMRDILPEFDIAVTDENQLVVEPAYLEIQRELLYNDRLRYLYSEKSLQSKTDKVYCMYDVCDRIRSMFPNDLCDDELMSDEYIFMIEKLTGINLTMGFVKYYTESMKLAVSQGTDFRCDQLLYAILDELIAMPNVLSRNYILKEFMEPVLFFKEGTIESKLECIGEQIERIRIVSENVWKEHCERIAKNISDEIKDNKKKKNSKKNKDNKKSIRWPFVFENISYYNSAESRGKDFQEICKYIFKIIKFNYIK